MPKKNRTKALLAQGKLAFGTMVRSFRTPEIIPLCAGAGWDYVILDSEHGPFNSETLSNLCLTASYEEVNLLVRIPESHYSSIAQPLDFGAEGLIIPHVETPEQARFVIESAKYEPQGHRGASTAAVAARYPDLPAADYIEWANRETMVVIQIETRKGLENVEEILKVPGLDAVMIGPFDLSQSLGIPADTRDPRMEKAFRRIIGACQQNGIAPGVHLQDPEVVRYWISQGMRFVTYQYDSKLFRDNARNAVSSLRAIPQGGG